jgi:tetratricopeptide (TPR) repeat protein
MLSAFSQSDPKDRAAARLCANAMVLLLAQYLDCEEAQEKPRFIFFGKKTKTAREKALDKYAALEKLAASHGGDPVMPGMLAWAKRAFIREDTFHHRAHEFESGLKDLKEFADRHPNNAFIIGEYAHACYCVFQEHFGHFIYDRAYQMILELERLVGVYGDLYREAGEADTEYEFPGYAPDNLDDHFTSALSEQAAHNAETLEIHGLLEDYKRLCGVTYPLESARHYLILEGQILSNLSYVYAESGDYGKSEEMIDRLRELAARGQADGADEWLEQSLIRSLSDSIYNLVTAYAEKEPIRRAARIADLLAELKVLAEAGDEGRDAVHLHTRYASTLHNICVNAPAEETASPLLGKAELWERLYAYITAHTVTGLVAEYVASGEVGFILEAGKTKGVEAAKHHRARVKTLASQPGYERVPELVVSSAVADFNLLVVASNGGDMTLAREMFNSLVEMAAVNPQNQGVVLRLVKGALNMITDYGDTGDLAQADAVYQAMLPTALPHADDPEIANRLVNAAFNLSVDLRNAGQLERVKQIYDSIANTKPNGEAAARLEKLKAAARR